MIKWIYQLRQMQKSTVRSFELQERFVGLWCSTTILRTHAHPGACLLRPHCRNGERQWHHLPPPLHSTVSWDSLHHTPAAELVARTKGFHVLPDLDLGYVSTTEQITVAIRILGMTLELRGRLNPTQASQLLCMGEGKGEHLQRSPKKCGRDWLAV